MLQARDVPATFFVVGARAAARPDLIRRMHDEGHEVGVHTFTHVNAANVMPRRLRLELDQSQLAIAGATGHTTSLLRLPYSSGVDGIGSSDWAAIRASGNYRVVYADLDTHDWSQPGVDAIIRAGLPTDGRGAIVMLHDGGGDRAQTVAALDGLITELMSRGYVFDTVTGAVGCPRRGMPHRCSASAGRGGERGRPGRRLVDRGDQSRVPRARRTGGRPDSAAVGARPTTRPARSAGPTCAPVATTAGVGDRARVQRGSRHRRDRPIHDRQRLPGSRGDRGRRRLHRRDRGGGAALGLEGVR